MSIYIGKSTLGTPLLHLTAGVTPIEDIKNSSIPSTVFHSALKYVTWEEVPCYSVNIRGVNFIGITPEAAASIGASKSVYFVRIGNSIVQGIQLVYNFETSIYNRKFGGWYSIYSYNGGFYQPLGYPTAENCYFLPPWGSNLSDIGVYKLNIHGAAYIGIPTSSAVIHIAPPSLTVNGVDLLNLKYFSPNPVNSVDATVSFAGSMFQLVNSYPASSISLVSNASETSIYKDSHILFSSLVQSKITYAGAGSAGTYIVSNTSFTLPGDCIGGMVVLFLRLRDGVGFYTRKDQYMPIILKIGSGNTVVAYNLVRYDDGASFGRFYISAVAGTSTVSIVRTNNYAGAWQVDYTYFK